MGRHLKFDKKLALDAATQLFWEQGYLNTSIKQLLTAMDMGESSFYHSFKSKKKLYITCLEHYRSKYEKIKAQLLSETETPEQKIYNYFSSCINGMHMTELKSCLLVNSLASDTIEKTEIKEYVFNTYDELISIFEKIIQDGIDAQQFKASLNPRATANILFSYLHGFIRLSNYDFDVDERLAETHQFLDSVLR